MDNSVRASEGRFTAIASKFGIYIALLALCVLMSLLSPHFLRFRTIMNILNQMSIIGIIAIGSTLTLLSGGLDLSPGSVVAVAGVMAAHFAHPDQYPLIVPIFVGAGVGLVFGAFNGFVTAKGKIPPFIVTLGVMSAGKGIALLVCDGMQVIDLSDEFVGIASGTFFLGIPKLVVYFAAICLIFFFLINNTRFGRHIYAVGGNELSAHISGVKVDRVKITVYALAGMLAGLGGLLLASRTVVGSPIAGAGYELDAIAAAVIGGTSTTGGVGSVGGTIVGALIIQVISTGLDMVNVPSYWQQIVKGGIIILAVWVDIRSKRGR